MRFSQRIILNNGKEALLKNGGLSDGRAVYELFNTIHAETDYLLAYPDENCFDPEQEAQFLEDRCRSINEIEIIAFVDSKAVGMAGIETIGTKYKTRHRAELYISVLKEYWGLGLGRALAEACIHCAKDAGYEQLELNVVADNTRAISMYKGLGFDEFGRNPRGFNSRTRGFQELIYMLLRL